MFTFCRLLLRRRGIEGFRGDFSSVQAIPFLNPLAGWAVQEADLRRAEDVLGRPIVGAEELLERAAVAIIVRIDDAGALTRS